MSELVAFRAPYPSALVHAAGFGSPVYFYFIDTRGINDWDFFSFLRRLTTGQEFLAALSGRKPGRIKIGFGMDFYDAILNEIVKEDADTLVIPSEERSIIRERVCKVRYL